MENKKLRERSKRGLTGNSGLIGNTAGVIHITASYGASDDECFVEYQPKWAGGGLWWRRAKLSTAKRRGWAIIECCQCGNAAKKLDHHYPFMSAMNLCDEHKYNPEMDT